MKKLLMLIVILFMLTSCASWRNQRAAKGSFLTTTEGDYIVVSQSGGEVMDVWKLESVFVEEVAGSDGWLFRDSDNNSTYIGGDAKVIRLNGDNRDQLWDCYHEYHMEFETRPYRELYGAICDE